MLEPAAAAGWAVCHILRYLISDLKSDQQSSGQWVPTVSVALLFCLALRNVLIVVQK